MSCWKRSVWNQCWEAMAAGTMMPVQADLARPVFPARQACRGTSRQRGIRVQAPLERDITHMHPDHPSPCQAGAPAAQREIRDLARHLQCRRQHPWITARETGSGTSNSERER